MVAETRIKHRGQFLDSIKSVVSDDEFVAIKSAKTADAFVAAVKAAVDIAGASDSDLAAIFTSRPKFNAKAVNITVEADGGEEVNVLTPDGPAPEEALADDDEGEDEPVEKARKTRPTRTDPGFGARLAKAAGGGAPAIGMASVQHKAYNRAASTGQKWRGKDVIWSDADTAEAATAWLRLKSFPNMDYPARRLDEAVVESLNIKELGSGSTSTGAWALPDEFSTDIIENMPKYGAVIRASGVHNMGSASELVPRITSDATVSVVGEGSSASDQDKPTGDNVRLTGIDVMALVRAQNSWLRDTPLNASGLIGESMARGVAKFVDQNALLSRSGSGASSSFEGIGDKIGSNSTYDAQYSSGWGEFTVTHDTQLRSKLPSRAYAHSERVGYIMSAANYMANFERLGLAAGGATPLDFTAGTRAMDQLAAFDADAIWNGKPVWFTPAMPVVYSANQISAYYGAWDIAMKFGRVGGNFAIASSDDRYFEFNQTGFRLVDSIAINCHDVNDTAESSDPETASLVVALKD